MRSKGRRVRCVARLLAVAIPAAVTGCGSISGNYPRDNPLVPAATLRVSENINLSFEKILIYAGVAYAAYVVLDPLAPNWQIDEAKMAEDQYALQLRMKRFHTGGDGESRVVFHRRAAQLARERGYTGYQILAYSEGLESTLPASQRVSEGVVRLVEQRGGH